ncbi:unnamed protein product [Gongylonema pulchrum]|uniref:Integrase catalytic domain-containing protein n=1 Tax=Gongylonema pulchrum TaxID=637853 RepID=A0A183DV90_9BILA|nr:unnamed protein product [Gongylonema pulchrum]
MVRRCRRRSVQYASFCDGFLIRGKDIEAECFHRQYFHFYRARVKLLQQRILRNAKQLLGETLEPSRLTGAKKEHTVLVIGTIAKRVKLRPSVLRDLAEEQLILPQPIAENKYVMFVSGFSFTGQTEKDAQKLVALDLLQKWLCGSLSVSPKERGIVERLVRLVVAGESVAITDQGREFTTAARYLIKNEECPNVECAAHMDKFLSKISSMLEVDVMPGLGDPSTHLMPQQPIHRAVFPKSSQHGKMLNLVTNPYHFSLDGVHIMGTSGESLSDLRRFAKEANSVDLLRKILDWQHLAPTVPDTIDGFPFAERDPFIIETFPHILFAANQSEVSHAIADFEDGRRTLLLSVPSFTKSSSVVLVNLRTLEVIEHKFSVDKLVCDS